MADQKITSKTSRLSSMGGMFVLEIMVEFAGGEPISCSERHFVDGHNVRAETFRDALRMFESDTANVTRFENGALRR
jgi:hypothetical protein